MFFLFSLFFYLTGVFFSYFYLNNFLPCYTYVQYHSLTQKKKKISPNLFVMTLSTFKVKKIIHSRKNTLFFFIYTSNNNDARQIFLFTRLEIILIFSFLFRLLSLYNFNFSTFKFLFSYFNFNIPEFLIHFIHLFIYFAYLVTRS